MAITKTVGKPPMLHLLSRPRSSTCSLHHLSTWKAELRVLVAAAQRQSEENSLHHPSHSGISPLSLSSAALPRSNAAALAANPTAGVGGDKVIFHVDFDCFFVSCGLATRPHLRGKPAVVCHSQGGRMEGSTSEIASASYEARAKGVKNGMSLGRARTLVGEDLQTIPYVPASTDSASRVQRSDRQIRV
jgi:DNA repair protein REV1